MTVFFAPHDDLRERFRGIRDASREAYPFDSACSAGLSGSLGRQSVVLSDDDGKKYRMEHIAQHALASRSDYRTYAPTSSGLGVLIQLHNSRPGGGILSFAPSYRERKRGFISTPCSSVQWSPNPYGEMRGYVLWVIRVLSHRLNGVQNTLTCQVLFFYIGPVCA